ncbi:MAG: DJ-1/PfpI family protein [Elusimicrobiota bacterium]|jgi:protease I|nr:DJ-1/PfpI family protein [Elusimicrobiota bacterium]
MKKTVFVVAPEIFRDEEYFSPKKILENAKIDVKTASLKKGELKGKLGGATISDMTIDEINPSDFDAIVYVGGGGASVYFNNPIALKLAKTFYNEGKIVSSICIAGVILANAGILKGKKATVFIDGKDDLIKGGADFTGNDVEIDGNIITANGPQAAEKFGKALCKALE